MTLLELVAYYVNLLIIQYFDKPDATATVGLLVQEALANLLIQQVGDGFDIPTAVGKQLDILAEYRGASRVLTGIPPYRQFFEMPFYSDPDAALRHGFLLYGDSGNSYFFLTYADPNTPLGTLSDPDFRTWLEYLAQVHSMDMGLGEVDNMLFQFFGSFLRLDDNQDMTIDYIENPADPNIFLFNYAAKFDALPRPAGVKITAEGVVPTLDDFAFYLYGESPAVDREGFGEYGAPGTGAFLEYF